jgi:hypothetical protein
MFRAAIARAGLSRGGVEITIDSYAPDEVEEPLTDQETDDIITVGLDLGDLDAEAEEVK